MERKEKKLKYERRNVGKSGKRGIRRDGRKDRKKGMDYRRKECRRIGNENIRKRIREN